eukprot:TRINITY_DN758_c0_g1_i1.p1 TRINITY_DN758_c0_g1~~TRINITY_DN758_c0_g1_i1.p1  ORF type:complete len:373 (+),score=100.34 TRINITY_DN758_c0_g1_i1:45-1163(+)
MKSFAVLGSLLSAVLAADVTVEGVTFNDAEQVAVLKVANEGSFETLHYTFDIFDRKAQNIIDGRKTSSYTTLQQLAAIDGVTHYVLKNCFKAEVNDICAPQPPQGGKYGRYTFTDEEAALALKAANQANTKSLVEVANIYSTNTPNIFRQRQICTMADLAEVTGQDVLRILRRFIRREEGACYEDSDCSTGMRCYGIPHDGILSTGKCGSTANVPHIECTETTPCPAPYVCSGLLMGWEQGTCRAEWQSGTFTTPYYISDIDVSSAKTGTFFPVSGQATVPEDILMMLDGSAVTNPQDLKIILTDPNGHGIATYWDGPNEGAGKTIPSSVRMLGSISRDDTVNGKWTVTITNAGSATGSITGFSLYLTSRWD